MESKKRLCERCKNEYINSFFTIQCRRCGANLCLRYRLPRAHLCPAVKWTFGNEPIKWYNHELTYYTIDSKTLEVKKIKQVSGRFALVSKRGKKPSD